MNANIKDEELYLLCDDTAEHWAITHKAECEELEKEYGELPLGYLKELIKKYSN